ncbi:MAG: hypothetical protein ACLFN8_04730 [Candidatus Woesearchaeota archaeon]
MSEIRRQTAYKCSIKQILESKYIQQQGLNPNYLDLEGVKASRVNIFAILVSKEGNTLRADDGTGQIQIMLFDETLKKNLPKLGKLTLIIGKPREHEKKIFIVPEIIKEINDWKWMDYRKLELKQLNYTHTKPKIKEEKENKKEIPLEDISHNYQDKILKKIKELDKGDGAPYTQLVNELNMKDADEKIQELIKEGEIFEILGKLKIL